MAWTQDELDAIVNQRLAWASRCTSAIAHDLGNLVLIGEVSAPAGAAHDASDATDQPTSLVKHFRDVLHTLETWRNIDRESGAAVPIMTWWQEQGGLLRQFVRRGIPVTMSKDPPARLVDTIVMTRTTAALLCAIDMQCPYLERLVLRASDVEGEDRLSIDFVPTPKTRCNGVAIPSIVSTQLGASPVNMELAVHKDDALFGLRVDAPRA